MELSCKLEYALLALMELASSYPQEDPLQIRQIAAQQGIPDRYLEQLLATLKRGGLVLSQRGAKGGYRLAKAPWKISLLEVIDCLEGGNSRRKKEKVGQTLESEAIATVWQEVADKTTELLQRYSLQDLCDRRDSQRPTAIMYYI